MGTTTALPPRRDVALAAALLAVSQVEVWVYGAGGGGAPAAVGLGVAAVAMVGVSRVPVVSVVLVVAGLWFCSGYGGEPVSITSVLTFFIAFVGVGAMANRVLALATLTVALVIALPATTPLTLNNYLAIALSSIVVPWLLGQLWLRRQRHRDEQSRLAQAQIEAVTQERLRLARELHDVVSHNVGMIAVQAGAADVLLDTNPAGSRDSLRAIENGARETLLELRRMLGLLRDDDPDTRSSRPALSDLDRFVAPMSAAGVEVRLTTSGEPRALAHDVELTAYRVVQEALTNAVAHAAPCRVELGLRYSDGALDVEIVDDGQSRGPSSRGGYGLTGLRERVTALGGTFDAGPRAGGGFRVHALLPGGAR